MAKFSNVKVGAGRAAPGAGAAPRRPPPVRGGPFWAVSPSGSSPKNCVASRTTMPDRTGATARETAGREKTDISAIKKVFMAMRRRTPMLAPPGPVTDGSRVGGGRGLDQARRWGKQISPGNFPKLGSSRNGPRSLDELYDHMANDELVG